MYSLHEEKDIEDLSNKVLIRFSRRFHVEQYE